MPFRKTKEWGKVQPSAGTPLNGDALRSSIAYTVGGVELIQRQLLTPSGSAVKGVGAQGTGIKTAGVSDQWDAIGTYAVSTTDFTIEVLLSMTVAPSLAQVFGAGAQLSGGFVTGGNSRYILCFGGGSNDDIYFFGGSADLDSGVRWRTDGSIQHVFITASGGTMTFYRDGRSIASGATPALAALPGASHVTAGSNHPSGTGPPTMTVFKGSVRNRALTPGEIAERTKYPWSDFVAPRRRIISGVAGGGGTTVALTGVSGTGAVGSVAAAVSVALTGVSGTGAVGTLTPAMSFALTGNAATGSVGSVSPAFSIPLTGNEATGAVGTVTPASGTIIALTGVSATGAVGTLSPAFSVGLTGVSATGSVGAVAVQGAVVDVLSTGGKGDNERRIFKPTGLVDRKKKAPKAPVITEQQIDPIQPLTDAVNEPTNVVDTQIYESGKTMSMAEIDFEIKYLMTKLYRTQEEQLTLLLLMAASVS